MVHFFIGTKAQFIKMAPVIVEMRNRGLPFRTVDSGQHAERTRSLRRAFNLPEPNVSLSNAPGDIVSFRQALAWSARLACRGILNRRRLRDEVFPGGGICLIHGDTLSALLGLQLARRAGLRVGHVEAGLRSFRRLDPFPEELIRVRCMRRADLLFAPDESALQNLTKAGVRGSVILVHGNTVADALRLAADMPTSAAVPPPPFALATCHRLETISSRSRLAAVVDALNRVARRIPVLLLLHEPTRRRLQRLALDSALDRRITQSPLVDYPDMAALLRSAQCVLSDGGSIQEECAYLNKPCLILRRTTERPDGLGRNATLWRFDPAALDAFLSKALDAPDAPAGPLPHPSSEIVDALVALGFAGPERKESR